MANAVEAGISYELSTHVEDLVDCEETDIVNIEGQSVGEHYADTLTSGGDNEFVILLRSGRKFRVTVEELTEVTIPGYNDSKES